MVAASDEGASARSVDSCGEHRRVERHKSAASSAISPHKRFRPEEGTRSVLVLTPPSGREVAHSRQGRLVEPWSLVALLVAASWHGRLHAAAAFPSALTQARSATRHQAMEADAWLPTLSETSWGAVGTRVVLAGGAGRRLAGNWWWWRW